MFFKPKVSVTYNIRLKRARAQFCIADCQKSRRPPRDAVDKAREKLEEELEDGHIEYYEIFDKKFQALWQFIHDHADTLPPDKIIRFTLAQGARAYSEIIVNRPRHAKNLAELSCQISERKAKTIFFNAFVFHVIRQLRDLGIYDKPNGAQLRFLYLVMKTGKKIESWALRATPRAEDYPDQKMLVELDQDHCFASLHIMDPSILKDESQCEAIYQNAVTLLIEKNSDKIPMNVLKEHTLEKLRSLTHKVQALGFGLPYSLLIGFDSSYRLDMGVMQDEKQKAAVAPAEELPRWKMRVGALLNKQKSEYIDISVDSSRMTASVARVHEKALAAIRKDINADWLLHECHKQALVFGYEEYLEAIVETIKKGQNPAGMRIAEGQPAKAGKSPYVHECYRDPPLYREGQVDAVREKQNRRIARVGQLIAEIRYEDGVPGRNVLGEEVHAVGSASEAKVSAGESVELREGGRFYAARDGLIQLNGGVLAVLKAYVHEGHVNLSSGNLAFDGAVVVLGDIEAGASVEVKGSLLVEGTIGNANVKVQGDLEVKGGIVTTRQGWVAVGGNCKAQFIENSRLQVKGHLTIASSLMNSEVVCGTSIVVADSSKGLISGGQISCWQSIEVKQMGLSQGQTTVCRIGTHYAAELRWSRLEQRLRELSESRETVARSLKELPPAVHARAEAPREVQREALQHRLNKTDKLLQHIIRRREELEQQLSWNANATLSIQGILDPNVVIHAAGKRIKVAQALKGVIISATAFRGSQITDIDAWQEHHKSLPKVDQAS